MRSIRRSWGLLAAALATVLAVAVAACGGNGDEVSAESYVSDVCESFAALTAVIEEGQAELDEQALATPEEGRDALVGFFDAAVGATESARSEIEDTGVPGVEGGQEAADAITGAFRGLTATFEQARGEAEEISVDSEAAFVADAEGIARRIQESSQQISESLEAVEEDEELAAAAAADETCQEL